MKWYQIFQKLPIFYGKMRLARLLFRNKNCETNFHLPNGLNFLVPNLIENVSFELYINGIYERKHLKTINSNLPHKGTFIDVGANIGAISVFLAKVRPDITIHAFKASPRVFHYLSINKEQNQLNNLHIYNLAIHKEDNLQLAFYSPEVKMGKEVFLLFLQRVQNW